MLTAVTFFQGCSSGTIRQENMGTHPMKSFPQVRVSVSGPRKGTGVYSSQVRLCFLGRGSELCCLRSLLSSVVVFGLWDTPSGGQVFLLTRWSWVTSVKSQSLLVVGITRIELLLVIQTGVLL